MRRATLASLCAFLAGIATLAASSDDYAPSDLTAAQILKRSTAAEGRLEDGPYVVLARSHGGGEDDTFVTRQDGSDYRTVDTSGDFTTAYGSYHGQSWTQDENGTVLLQSDFVAKTDPNILALEHPEDPKYNVKAFGITRAANPQYVVEVNPPGGSDQFRYYDVKTMLLTQTVTFSKDRHKHVFAYADYRTAFGETRAYHTHYTDGRNNNDTDTWVTSILKDPSPAPLTIPTSRPLYTVPEGGVRIPARFTDAGIIVRVTIAGRGFDFVLDSGASTLAFDADAAGAVGIHPYGKTTDTDGGEIDESRAYIPQMQVGPLTLGHVATSLVPLSFSSQDGKIVGLLGCDFIAGSIVGIDFGKQTVTLYPRASFNPQQVGATVHRSIDVDDGIPRVSGSIEGVAGNFLIDTGSFLTVLYPNYLHKLPNVSLSDDPAPTMGTVGGALRTHAYNVADLTLGPIVQKSAQVTVPSTSTWDILDYDGVFGRGVLKDAAIYFDYANRLVYYKPEL